MLVKEALAETSRFLSYVLRHKPEAIGLVLDTEGWTDVAALIAGAANAGRQLDAVVIRAVVETNDKQRFALGEDGLRIRAVQGHSTPDVARAFEPRTPPRLLFHGTATRFLESIRAKGLVPGQRHHVHLSADAGTARLVGQRHGLPVLLTLAAGTMHDEGFTFYQAENGVWLTTAVPSRFLEIAPQDLNDL